MVCGKSILESAKSQQRFDWRCRFTDALVEVEHHCDFGAVAVFRTCYTVFPDLHRQVFVLDRPETHLLEEAGREREGEDLGNLFRACLFNKSPNDGASGLPTRLRLGTWGDARADRLDCQQLPSG